MKTINVELTEYELLNIYSGLEIVWKDRIKQANNSRDNLKKREYFLEESEKINQVRKKINDLIIDLKK